MTKPLKLTPALQAAICKLIRVGVHPRTACAAEGIHRATYYEWRKRGEEGEEPFAAFLDATNCALAAVHGELEQGLVIASRADWRAGAWLLSKRARDVYGDRHAVQVEGAEVRHSFRPLSPEVAEEIRRKILYGEHEPRPPRVSPRKPTDA